MELIDPQVQAYAETYSSAENPLLKEIAAYTARRPDAHMMSGHLQGRFLEMVSAMIRPLRVLEIGTFTGYSAICLAAGMDPSGLLHSIELRPEDAAVAKGFFDRSPYRDRIILHTGNALELVPQLEETWDLVFIDADKPAYIQYFNLVLPRLRKNGFILADNIFFHGEVLGNEVSGKSAKGIQAFNEFIEQRTDIEKVIVTLRDGLFLIRKL